MANRFGNLFGPLKSWKDGKIFKKTFYFSSIQLFLSCCATNSWDCFNMARLAGRQAGRVRSAQTALKLSLCGGERRLWIDLCKSDALEISIMKFFMLSTKLGKTKVSSEYSWREIWIKRIQIKNAGPKLHLMPSKFYARLNAGRETDFYNFRFETYSYFKTKSCKKVPKLKLFEKNLPLVAVFMNENKQINSKQIFRSPRKSILNLISKLIFILWLWLTFHCCQWPKRKNRIDESEKPDSIWNAKKLSFFMEDAINLLGFVKKYRKNLKWRFTFNSKDYKLC